MKTAKYFILSSLIFLAASCSLNPSVPSPMPTTGYNTSLHVGSANLSVEIATTTQQMTKGLSGRTELLDNQGMLFDYQGVKTMPVFWMPDMNFDIDILWIADKKVVGIEHSVPALKVSKEQLPRYQPAVPVDMVLEVQAGWADKHGIKVGDVLKISN